MAANTFTIELSDQDRNALMRCVNDVPDRNCRGGGLIETVGFTDGVHLFSSVDDAERWMLQEIPATWWRPVALTLDEFRKRLKPNEGFLDR